MPGQGPRQGAQQGQPYGTPPGMPYGPQGQVQPPQAQPPQGRPPQGPFEAPEGPRRRILWTAAIVGGVVVVLAAVIGVTGGFASDGTGPDDVAIGKPVDQTQFESTVVAGYWEQKKVLGKTSRSMVARLRVTNSGDRSASLNDYLKTVIPLQAWGGGLLSSFDTKAYTGGSETDQLPPGVPVDVLAHYVPNTGEEHATKLTLRFCGVEHRSDFYYRGHQVWVPECDNWATLDKRELVTPQAISGPGITQQQKVQKANELRKQGQAARKAKAFSTTGIVAQVNVPLKGAP